MTWILKCSVHKIYAWGEDVSLQLISLLLLGAILISVMETELCNDGITYHPDLPGLQNVLSKENYKT